MATLVMKHQTIAGLLEVGDQLRTGTAGDDFVTVMARWTRPTYVKLEVELFNHERQIVRVPLYETVLLAPNLAENDEPTEDKSAETAEESHE